MNKKLTTLYLICTSSVILAQELKTEGGWVPTKQSELCYEKAHSNMTAMYFCVRKDTHSSDQVSSYKMKKINNHEIVSKWHKLQNLAKLQCKKEIDHDLKEVGLEEIDDNVEEPDYLSSIYACIGDKYSNFNRQFLNARRRRFYEK